MLVTSDIQKACNSVNHQFLTLALKRCGLGKIFNKYLCIINGWRTTKYFKLEKRTYQGDIILVYSLIPVLEIVCNLIKGNKGIHGLNFLEHNIFYTVYTNGTTFFLKDKESVKELLNVFDTFWIYSGLKSNRSICEIAEIGALKGPSMELCGMEWIDLTKNSFNKILKIRRTLINILKKLKCY